MCGAPAYWYPVRGGACCTCSADYPAPDAEERQCRHSRAPRGEAPPHQRSHPLGPEHKEKGAILRSRRRTF